MVSGNIDASLASHHDIETKAPPKGLDSEEVEPLTSSAKIIRPVGGIEFGVQGMK